MTLRATNENNRRGVEERTYIFDVEDMIILIEHYIDRSRPFSAVASIAAELLEDIIPWMTVDYMVAVRNARDRLQLNGVEFVKSHELAQTLVFTLMTTFERFYGKQWFVIVSRCRISVQRQTNLYVYEDLTSGPRDDAKTLPD